MTNVLICRHGESVWNREGRIQGVSPVELTEEGQEQAVDLGMYIHRKYDVTDVYSSPVKRAVDTVERVMGTVDGEMNFEEVPNLREREVGFLKGYEYAEVDERYPEYISSVNGTQIELLDEAPPNGETTREVYSRVNEWWQSLLTEPDSEKDMLVATHGAVTRCLESIISGKSLETVYVDSDGMGNCGLWVVKLTEDGGEFIKRYDSINEVREAD